MSKFGKKGFTLIELLVVIAIIGILASIVLASLNTARNKGADASIKGNLSSIRVQAEVYYDTNNNYGDDFAAAACPTTGTTVFAEDATIKNAIAEADKQSNGAPTCAADDAVVAAGTAATSWAVSVPLRGGGNWCVDYTGASKLGSATVTSNVASCS